MHIREKCIAHKNCNNITEMDYNILVGVHHKRIHIEAIDKL